MFFLSWLKGLSIVAGGCFLLLCAPVVSGSVFSLAKDGAATSCVVIAANSGPMESHAAEELALYIGRITGAKVEVSLSASKDKYNVYVGTGDSWDLPLSSEMKGAMEKVGGEGFMIAADPDGLRIVGKKPVGALYGVYSLLKKHGDVRWFFPGPEGEFCPRKPSFSVPGGISVENPSFPTREINLVCASITSKMTDTWDWMARNGIQLTTRKNRLAELHPKEREKRGMLLVGGGHVFSSLISDKLFDEHPEYFALIEGRRVRQAIPGMGDRNQPCTSNPNVVDIMGKNLLAWADAPPKGDYFLLGNNDGTGWCQCDSCVRLDPPDEREKKFVGTRYWTLLNELAARALSQKPDLSLKGWAYQNFQEPPVGIVPDKRFSVVVCVHGRCYRHPIDDARCPLNGRFRDMLDKWARLNPVSTYEYTNMLPGGEILHLPTERVFVHDLKYYHKIGLKGSLIEVPPPDGVMVPPWDTRKVREMWRANWWHVYMTASFLWNVNADYQSVLEDAGVKYYGKAWPQMSQYRSRLAEAFEETPGDMIYGTPDIALGKCLDKPGAEAGLLKLLDDAEKAAGKDEAVLKRIRLDREYFDLSWRKMHKTYVDAAQNEIGAVKGSVVVDGVLSDPDWRKADFVTGFVDLNGGGKSDEQTFVRILYEKDNIFLGIEAMEPEPSKMKSLCSQKDGPVWDDNGVEIFLSAPESTGKYLHIIANSNGVVYDSMASGMGSADAKFDSGAEVRTSILKDKWVLEARIPTSVFGLSAKDGETWKINVARNRVLSDGTLRRGSLCGGAYHGADAFRSVAFGGRGLIQNGDFEDVGKPRNYPKWKFSSDVLPTKWVFHDMGGRASLVEGGAASGRRFLRVASQGDSPAVIFQPVNIREADKLLVRAKVRGKGSVSASMFLYDLKTRKYLSTKGLGEKLEVDSKDWAVFEAVYDHDGKTSPSLALFFSSPSGIDIDDVVMLRGGNMDGLGGQ